MLSLQEGARLLVELRNSLLRQETSSTDDEQEESAAGAAASEQGSTEKLDRLADSNLTSPLLKVLHRMLCYESGKGLTVSELGAKLVKKCNQQDLQGELIPRSVKLARIMRSCPYFAKLEGHRFTLWSKILAQPQPVPDQQTRSAAKVQEQAKSAACAKVGGMKCLDLGSLNKKQEKNADQSYQKKRKLEIGLVGDGPLAKCAISISYPHGVKSFQRMLHKEEGKRARWEYPFAVADVNISFRLIQMLDLRSAKPSSNSGVNFLKILGEDEMAFDMLYCVAFEVMDAQWLAMHASYMEFNAVLGATYNQIERELSLKNVTSEIC